MCLLLDIPATAFQAVLQHLTAEDVADLRHVSSAVCKCTTQHAPYVCLRLSPSSSPQYPEAWCQATQQLQHVQVVHININGVITLDVFDAALQSLSKQRRVTALHLVGVKSARSGYSPSSARFSAQYTGCIPSLQPIKHLKASMKLLVITDLDIESFDNDLQQLANTSKMPFQLQQLTVCAGWLCKGRDVIKAAHFIRALLQMTKIFPCLQRLDLRIPSTTDESWRNTTGFLLRGIGTSGVPREQLQAIALIAGFARAISCLQHLQTLTITGLPDPWEKQAGRSATAADATTAATALKGLSVSVCESELGGLDVLDKGLMHPLPLESAAAACSTMDNVGCWLLEQQPKLLYLQLGCGDWSMSWRKHKQQPKHLPCSSQDTDCTAIDTTATMVPSLVAIQADYHHSSRRSSAANIENNSDTVLLDDFIRYLSSYSPRPALSLLNLITSCRLYLYCECAEDKRLFQLLAQMQSLKKLKISASMWTDTRDSDTPAASMSAATAAVPGLECLELSIAGGMASGSVRDPGTLLLPLTAAAGGPRCLKVLHLRALFEPGANGDPANWQALRHLDCLQELHVQQLPGWKLNFPVDSLPASLEVFKVRGFVKLSQGSAVGISGNSSSADVTIGDQANAEQHASAKQLPNLCVLDIRSCQLEDPSILASDKLQVLIAGHQAGKWQGGWSAAAAAWPSVRKLQCLFVYEGPRICSNQLHMCKNVVSDAQKIKLAAAAVEEPFKCVCKSFPGLKLLMVTSLPYLTTEMTQLLIQQLKHVQHVSMVLADLPWVNDLARISTDRFASIKDPESSMELQNLLKQQLPWATVDFGPGQKSLFRSY